MLDQVLLSVDYSAILMVLLYVFASLTSFYIILFVGKKVIDAVIEKEHKRRDYVDAHNMKKFGKPFYTPSENKPKRKSRGSSRGDCCCVCRCNCKSSSSWVPETLEEHEALFGSID